MRKFVLFIGLYLFWFAGFATHQRAGEITYKQLNKLSYEFTIITYTYTPSPADRPEIEVFWGDGSSSVVQRLSKTSVGNDISKNTYVSTHTYSSQGIYSVTFEDPNRNAGIINIPNSVNIPFFIETIIVINNFMPVNNSVVLLNPPLDNGCVNTTYYHNVGAYDPDGDSISYKLIDCRGLDGLPIPGYKLPQASQFIQIDEFTGDLIWETPMIQGEYNIAILISEYRKGEFMGSVVRDMQITIAACDNKPPQIFRSDTCVIAGSFIDMDVLVTDETSTQVTLSATGTPFFVSNSPAIPMNVTGAVGTDTLRASFLWQTVCAHIQKKPYQVFFKATDNGPQVNLTAFKTINISVIAPPPEHLSATSIKNTIALEWDKYSCENAQKLHIYKKADSSFFAPDVCETGIPSYTGFHFLESVNASDTIYLDDGKITPVAHGREYCYRIVAVFKDGAESIASNEACAAIANDAPLITHVDIEQTSENEGIMFVKWLPPPEIDTLNFPGPRYEYRLFRSAENLNNFEYLSSTYSLFDTSFTDNSLNTDGIQYFYKVEFWGENTQGTLELIEISDPASSIFLSVYGTNKRLKLTWNEHVPWKNESYIIYRSTDKPQKFDPIAATVNNHFDDVGLENGETYCYYIKSVGKYPFADTLPLFFNRSQQACGVPEDNVPPCLPITEIQTDCQNVTFSWHFPDSCYDSGEYQYYIYYQPNYQTPMFCIDSFFHHSECIAKCTHIIQNLPSITGCYAMKVRDLAGNFSEMTPKLCFDVDECDTYRLPNVFTPDGDGINDTFFPFPYTNVQKIKMDIHDRWGRRVFRTEDPDINWDGTDENSRRPSPEGVYYYGCDVYLYTLNGIKKKFLSGIITILRDRSAKQKY